MSTGFAALHPALQFHIVNSLGWSELRPLQDAACGPLCAGVSALLVAPTAAGKTEAAMLPILSRMLSEGWGGLSVLYLCPLKALLNNLEPRLGRLAGMVGRRVALWHGDVGAAARSRIVREPPDVLLTTPESLEAVMISARRDAAGLFADLHAVVIDEAHAFAASDRGWHLQAVLQRLSALLRRPLQRVGLSATVGDPMRVAAFLAGPEAQVIGEGRIGGDADLRLDHVGALEGAAKVIAGLHRGEKRLVFCDSRASVERLGLLLRQAGINTWLSHGALSQDQRRQAEDAFATGNDCVIVATSTLELGLDVGDLDRVIQIDAPGTVSAFLQRLGRSGRRKGSVRNMLFLATREESALQAAALVDLFAQGWVEPSLPPPLPVHLVAQQILALCLQQGRCTRSDLVDAGAAGLEGAAEHGLQIQSHLLQEGWIIEADGLLQIGPKAEQHYGRRYFRDLTASFLASAEMTVMAGNREIGQIDPAILVSSATPTVLLGGHAWTVVAVDWRRRQAAARLADPGEVPVARWLGGRAALSATVARSMGRIAGTGHWPARLVPTRRAEAVIQDVLERFAPMAEGGTMLEAPSQGRPVWWTFAGLGANLVLKQHLMQSGINSGRASNLGLTLEGDLDRLKIARSRTITTDTLDLVAAEIAAKGQGYKFEELLPFALLMAMTRERMLDPQAAGEALLQPVRTVILTD